MDYQNYITNPSERKPGEHLTLADRGAIQALHNNDFSNCTIGRYLHCSPTIVGDELKRGTPPRTSRKGRAPGYNPKFGQTVYKANRNRCRKRHSIEHCSEFVDYVVKNVREHKWSLDECAGRAKRLHLYPENDMVCCKTLYNELNAGNLPLTLFEVPNVLKRRDFKRKNHINKRPKGRSIDERPSIVDERVEPGHWEADTVVGKKKGKESVVFSLVERVSDNYISIKIPGRNSKSIQLAMELLHEEYGEHFSEVFKTITADNGPEFEDFAQNEKWGTKIYFAHPYSSWERPVNERHNGLLREFIPKGVSMEQFTAEQIMSYGDELNGRPRKRLGYQTPEELFEAFLDEIYAL